LIYPIIDDNFVERDQVLEVAFNFIKSGIKVFQYRAKNTSLEDILSLSYDLTKLSQKHKVRFIVNDYLEIALKVKADGVHLGQDDVDPKKAREILGLDKIIGISTHTLKQAQEAKINGADYISFGPIFKTSTKKDAFKVRGVELLRRVILRVDLPIVAIGGINRENMKEVLGTEVSGIAFIAEIYKSPELLNNLLSLRDIAYNTRKRKD